MRPGGAAGEPAVATSTVRALAWERGGLSGGPLEGDLGIGFVGCRNGFFLTFHRNHCSWTGAGDRRRFGTVAGLDEADSEQNDLGSIASSNRLGGMSEGDSDDGLVR